MRLVERLIALRYGIAADTVLNADDGGPSPSQPPDPERLGASLLDVRIQAVSTDSDGFDYGAVAESDAYGDYRRCVSELRAFDPGQLAGRERRLAFWINLYNGLVLDAVVQWKVQRGVGERPGFFWRAAYDIGGLRYSANDIENGILRANAPHPAVPGAPFGKSDARRRFSLDHLDPRVHFALTCASRSCPPVAVYAAQRIDERLDQATRSFIRGGGVEIDPVRGQIRLSRLFQWYAGDFGARRLAIGDKRPLLRFIAAYLDPIDARLVLARRQWAMAFTRYDWSLNGVRDVKAHAS